MRLKKKKSESQNLESSKSEIGWGHQIRSYVLQPYRLVKDNRTNFESSSPDKVLNGDIDEFLEQSLYQIKMKLIFRTLILLLLSTSFFVVYFSYFGFETKKI